MFQRYTTPWCKFVQMAVKRKLVADRPSFQLSPRKLHPVFHLKGGICVQKKTRSFRVFPPENREFKNRGISNIFF